MRIRVKIALLLFLSAIAAGCSQKTELTTITVKFASNPINTIRYTRPIEGICHWGFCDTIRIDSLGLFHISLSINKPTIIRLLHPVSTLLAIEPGKEYSFEIDSNSKQRILKSNHSSEGLQKYYNSLPTEDHPFFEVPKFRSTPPIRISHIIDSIMVAEERAIDSIASSANLPNTLTELVKLDRQIYYTTILGGVATMNAFEAHMAGIENTDKDVIELWNEAMNRFDINDPRILNSQWAYYYLDSYLQYKERNDKKNNWPHKSREYSEKEMFYTYKIELSKDYLPAKAQEFYTAALLFERSYQKRFELELISIYEKFKEEHPNNDYNRNIYPLIKSIENFHEMAKLDFSDKVTIINNYNDIKSLSELTGVFKNKRVYVDVWSTSCGHCKTEFKHGAALKELLQSQGIDMLYISIDGDKNDQKWKTMIKYYDLEGYHIRASKELEEEIDTKFGVNGVPHYALIDNKGGIIAKTLERPSRIKELENDFNKLSVINQ